MLNEVEVDYRIIRDEVREIPQFADYEVSEAEIETIAGEVAQELAGKMDENEKAGHALDELESKPYRLKHGDTGEERIVTFAFDSTRDEIFYIKDYRTKERYTEFTGKYFYDGQ